MNNNFFIQTSEELRNSIFKITKENINENSSSITLTEILTILLKYFLLIEKRLYESLPIELNISDEELILALSIYCKLFIHISIYIEDNNEIIKVKILL